MSKYQELRNLLFRLLKENFPIQSFEAVVKSVDKDNRSCVLVPTDERPEVFDARLTAIIDDQDSYFVVWPEVESIVLAIIINSDPNEVFIASVSEVESVEFKIGEMTFKSDANGHVFNGGEKGGLTVIANLVSKVNQLENKFNNHVHPGVTSGAGTTGAVVDKINPTTTVSDLENNKVKH